MRHSACAWPKLRIEYEVKKRESVMTRFNMRERFVLNTNWCECSIVFATVFAGRDQTWNGFE